MYFIIFSRVDKDIGVSDETNEDDEIVGGVLTMAKASSNRTTSQFFIHLGCNSWMKSSSSVVSKGLI